MHYSASTGKNDGVGLCSYAAAAADSTTARKQRNLNMGAFTTRPLLAIGFSQSGFFWDAVKSNAHSSELLA